MDNGWIKFTDFYIPKFALLNRFADIDANGNYTSSVESKGKWFAMHIACLSGGRVNVPKCAGD